MSRVGALLLLLGGCGGVPAYSPPPNSAKMVFAVHAEGTTELAANPKVSGGVDVDVERVGCCSLGLYFSAAQLSNAKAKEAANVPELSEPNDDRSLEVLDGGLELGVVLPALENRFRLRARAGASGTAPRTPALGRSGISTSLMAIARLWRAAPPAPNHFSPDIDLLLGYSALSLGRENTSAGFVDERYSHHAFVVGLRLGADYGLDLE